jgi:AAA+ ATPase superfamily predicted ATPase
MEVVGRFKEREILENALTSNQSELIVVYGRRRVGKTFLIREFYKSHIQFEFSGTYKATAREQLKRFKIALFKQSKKKQVTPKSWIDAFYQLEQYCDSLNSKGKKVIFLDEFPWLDNNKSSFLKAFDYFWNSYATKRTDLVVVVCGSAASYMINRIIRNKGGLHNRLTEKIRVEPFTLHESELLLKKKNLTLTKYDILYLHMVMGGIPHYLEKIKSGESATQAIDRLCFEKDGFLRNEFKEIFASLFEKADNHETIIRTLAKIRQGLTRTVISQKCKLPSGGNLTRTLNELEESGFITQYQPFKGSKNSLFRLSDEYCNFYLKYIEGSNPNDNGVWNKIYTSPSFVAWSGYTFEAICLKHIKQIKEGLKIAGIQSTASSWINNKTDNKTQIDLLIDRSDNVINICELKFYKGQFTIDKDYHNQLIQKIQNFTDASKTRKSVMLTMITTYGLNKNEYSNQLVQNELTLEHLFLY